MRIMNSPDIPGREKNMGEAVKGECSCGQGSPLGWAQHRLCVVGKAER